MRIYNTLSRNKEELKEKKIGIYVCGPTVYDEPHIGHARSAYVFDVIIKYLRFKKLKVTFVRNVTDIDDKIIEKAKTEPGENDLKYKVTFLANRYLKRYHEDMDLLGLARPDIEPKATETIRDMITFIQELMKKGVAYGISSSVYFDVRKFKDYGKLSGQSIDEMQEGARVALDKNKKDPLDFALWKSSKEDEPFWESPWGNGRPGWHIECSVMSTKFLGNDFVIHAGGLDLVFPHHENEIAQTVCAGKKSAKYWLHNGLLTINGQKMSKSLGNFITIKDFAAKFADLDLLKLLFLSSHYRHPVDYTEEKIEKMRGAKERILIFLQRTNDLAKIKNQKKIKKGNTKWMRLFETAMDDDFNTPAALSVMFQCVDEGNKAMEKTALTDEDYNALCLSRDFIGSISKTIFSLDFECDRIHDEDVLTRIKEREKARRSKDFVTSDRIRSELLKQGIILEDTRDGTVWRRKI